MMKYKLLICLFSFLTIQTFGQLPFYNFVDTPMYRLKKMSFYQCLTDKMPTEFNNLINEFREEMFYSYKNDSVQEIRRYYYPTLNTLMCFSDSILSYDNDSIHSLYTCWYIKNGQQYSKYQESKPHKDYKTIYNKSKRFNKTDSIYYLNTCINFTYKNGVLKKAIYENGNYIEKIYYKYDNLNRITKSKLKIHLSNQRSLIEYIKRHFNNEKLGKRKYIYSENKKTGRKSYIEKSRFECYEFFFDEHNNLIKQTLIRNDLKHQKYVWIYEYEKGRGNAMEFIYEFRDMHLLHPIIY